MKDDPQMQQQDISIWLALQMKFKRATVPQRAYRTPAVRPRDQDEPHDDAHPEGKNSAKRQKTSEYEAYVSGESSSGEDLQEELAPSTSEEVSLTIDEAKLRKMADEMIETEISVETEFPAIAFNDEYSTKDLKTDSKNDNEKVMPSLPPPEPAISCFDDLDFFKDFKNEFPAIVYNDALTSKSNLLTEPILNPQHINEFDLKNKTSFSGYDEEEQSVLYFNYLFPFNIIRPDDLKSENDNDDNDIDIIQSSRGNEIIDGSSVLSKTSHDKELKVFILSTAKLRVSTAQVTTASTNQLVLL
ncbi:hypothetical protein Tco_1162416, partial [Tanacetum coccineum]